MKRPLPLLLAAVAALVLIALSLYLRSWGGVVLVVVAAAVYAWYRVQVARSEAAEQFFGDLGEETRLTGFQGGASEMPVDRHPADSKRR
jgi:O-antigen ligase